MIRHLLAAALPAVSALSLVSCAFDPYGFAPAGGPGYGSYSGSVFVSTGDARWGYDPYRYCYYDYGRRCYYDPYLGGYYPVGFLPPPLVGCPHPGGWIPGHGLCPPPHGFNDRWLDRYHDRLGAIKASNYEWASRVRTNRQTQIEHMRTNNAAWANRVRDSRQTAIENQRGHMEAIRGREQTWAERTRENRQDRLAGMHEANARQADVYRNARLKEKAANQTLYGHQGNLAGRRPGGPPIPGVRAGEMTPKVKAKAGDKIWKKGE